MKKDIIVLECASWYETEKGHVQIINKYGNKVILSNNYSILWKTIYDEKKEEDLENELMGVMTKDEIKKSLKEMEKCNLISFHDEEDSFDLMF